MKTVIQVLLLALLMGGLSAAASVAWQKQHATPVATNDEPEPTAVTSDAPADVPEEPESALEPSRKPQPKSENRESTGARTPEPPVAVRPPWVEDADDASWLVTQLRERLAAASQKETRLSERQEALNLIFGDIRSEQLNVNNLRRQISDELDEATTAARSAQEERDLLKRELEALQKSSPAADDDNVNLKRMGVIYDSMPPEAASGIFQQLVKSSRQEAVLQLLYAMKDRQASKVLASIAESDPRLAATLTEQLKKLKNPLPNTPAQ